MIKIEKKKKYLLIVTLIFLIFYLISNFYTKEMVVGIYVNRNYNNTFINDIAHKEDTLKLFNDNKFTSPYYGNGTYKLIYEIDGTYIRLSYNDGTGRTSFKTSIYRSQFFWKNKAQFI